MPTRRDIWALDCETDPFLIGRIPAPFLWGTYNKGRETYVEFSSASEVCDFFARKKCVVYAHNGGKFDYHYLRDFINADEPVLIINGRIARFKIGDAEFRDSFNILPVALAAYQKEKVDYRIFERTERDKPENRRRISEYLKSDCVNLANFLARYFAEYGSGLTQAGASMNHWSRKYRAGSKPRQTGAQFQRYRPYYYGGRVECFRAGYGRTRFSVVDINSAYPFAMLDKHPMSCEAMRVEKVPDGKMTQCLITLRGVANGCFPYRLDTGELIFPCDDLPRTYHVTGWELAAAQEMGAVKVEKILDVHYFHEVVDFADYIGEFYKKRLAAKASGDKAGDIFAKIFMNSLYGKFASDPENYHEYVIATEKSIATHEAEGFIAYQPWGGRTLCWRKLPVEKHRYFNVATAASITGFVRAYLLRSMHKVRGSIYCDTDSIAAENISALPLGTALGEWKLELECDEYAVAGKKLYAFRAASDCGDYKKGQYKIACKGVKLDAAEIIKAARGGIVEYQPEVPTYSVARGEPRFIPRTVKLTAKVQRA